MPHILDANPWILDVASTGLLSTTPVSVNRIAVIWKTVSAGTVEFTYTIGEASAQTRSGFMAKTSTASTAAMPLLTQMFDMGGHIFPNLTLAVAGSLDSLYVYTK